MRSLLIAITGFLAGGALVVGLLFALPKTTTVTVKQAAPQTAAMPQMSGGMSMAGSTMASN